MDALILFLTKIDHLIVRDFTYIKLVGNNKIGIIAEEKMLKSNRLHSKAWESWKFLSVISGVKVENQNYSTVSPIFLR